MTVRELIERLSTHDPDATVRYYLDDEWGAEMMDVTNITVEDDDVILCYFDRG